MLMALVVAMPVLGSAPAEASTAAISGTAFQDLNRDGVQQADEEPFVDHHIYLLNESGNAIASTRTDQDGAYRFSGLDADRSYTVIYDPSLWRQIWEDWVPTTTGSLQPEREITFTSGSATADFGWRPIVTSTDDPITEVVGDEGLTVQSYNDVISAGELYDLITGEYLVGAEASSTTVRFARSTNSASSRISWGDDGEITAVSTTANVTYRSWLRNGDRMLAHEYGHAWMNYHGYYTQQDRDWVAFLEARGIDPDDDRLGSSYAWEPAEIAADDYRQLFASENARSGGQINNDIPRPWDVEGFEEFLRGTFSGSGSGDEPVDEGSTEDGTNDDSTEEEGSPDDGAEEDTSGDGGSTEDDGSESSDDEESSDEASSEDDEAPLTITSPEDDAEVSSSLTVRGLVTSGLTRVDVTIDGTTRRAELADDGTWRASLSGIAAGEHTVSVAARGPRGMRAEAAITVLVHDDGSDDDGTTTSPGNNGNGVGPKK